MRITAFEGGKGDCLLLESNKGKNLLMDGGHVDPHFKRIFSYHDNVAPTLGKLRKAGKVLDLVAVSHIDQDHIGGILSMLDDEFNWRVYEYQKAQGLTPRKPAHPRPPQIKAIWHNSFHEQLEMNRGDIEDAIAAVAPLSLALGIGPKSHGEDLFSRLATSMTEAAKVSRRIGEGQLGIPLNPEFKGKLVQRIRKPPQVKLGDLKITVLGPTKERLTELRTKWNKWLRSTKGKAAIRKLRHAAEGDEDLLATGDLSAFLDSAALSAALGDLTELIAAAELGPAIGNRASVSKENVASIIMMVEEEGKRVLLTGDARDDHIIEDLTKAKLTDRDGHIHVDVLKIQHHASENNFSKDFGKRVTADHYVFCGNGQHENPDRRVVQNVLDSRIGTASRRSPNCETGNKFKLWFTSDGSTTKADKEHMELLRKDVASRQRRSPGRFTYHFSSRPYLRFTI